MISANSFARVVLSGEHSVVYGYPAVVSGIDLAVSTSVVSEQLRQNDYVEDLKRYFTHRYQFETAHLNISVDSQIPVGSGLSSSTAVASAVFQVLAEHFEQSLSKDDLFNLLVEFESQFYPVSGMDQAAVTYGGLIKFQKKLSGGYSYETIETNIFTGRKFFLIDSGKPNETTSEMVAKVKGLDKNKRDHLLKKLGEVSTRLIECISSGEWQYELVGENQKLLEALGVVGQRAKDMVRQIETIGGVAKISGAGGIKTGSGILLAYHQDMEKLEDLVERQGWKSWVVELGSTVQS